MMAGPEFWPAVGYAALGAGVGSGVKQGTYLATGSPDAPQSPGQAALTFGTDVAENAAAEGAGRIVAKPIEWAAGKIIDPIATRLYRGALRPPISVGPQGAIDLAQTGLREGIPVSEKGYWRARGRIDAINDQIQKMIDAKSAELGAVIDPGHVAEEVEGQMPWARNQVNPEADIKALQDSKAEWMRQHTTQAPYTKIEPFTDPAEAQAMGSTFYPNGQGSTPITEPMTLSEAQAIKWGTYGRLRGKYGELGSAQIEGQKALARGLRQDIQSAFPQLQKLNERDRSLIDLEEALAKHAINTPGGPGWGAAMTAAVAGHPEAGFALHMLQSAYKSPEVRSKLAIALYRFMHLPRVAATMGAHGATTQLPRTIKINPEQSFAGGFKKGGSVRSAEVDRLAGRALDRRAILESLQQPRRFAAGGDTRDLGSLEDLTAGIDRSPNIPRRISLDPEKVSSWSPPAAARNAAPPPPKAPLPAGLGGPAPDWDPNESAWTNFFANGASTGDPLTDQLIDVPRSGINQVSQGLGQIAGAYMPRVGNEPETTPGRQIAGGIGNILGGAAQVAAPVALPAAALAAPEATALAFGTGALGDWGAQRGAELAGLAPEYQDLAGQIGGFLGGELGEADVPALVEGVRSAGAAVPDVLRGAVDRAGAVNDLINQSLNYSGTSPERGSFSRKPVPRVENAAGVSVRGTMGGAKGTNYFPLPEDVQALAVKLKPDNPDAALRQAAATLKWRNWDKPAAEAEHGPLVRSAPSDPKLARLQNTPERVQQRIQEAQSFLSQPTEPWTPRDYGIFDRSLIPQAMAGFPDVEQTAFPRTQPTRADLSYIDEIYNDPTNRALIKTQIARGLPLGGETFYPSLYPVKAEAISRGLRSDYFPQTGGDLFDNWIHSVAPGSARNSIYNERSVGNFLRNMKARNIPLTPENVAAEMQAFKDRYGVGLPLMDVHRAGAARVLEQGISPADVLRGNLTDSYKIPTYSVQQTGNFGHSWTGDVHEATGETLGSRYNPYFTEQGGFGVNEYGRAEQHMRQIAAEMGLPTGTAQAGRWFGGGELTGVKSPRGDSLDLLERQIAYTLHAQGQPTDPVSIRSYAMKLMQQGGDLLPWFKGGPMPEYRQLR
jgi:hypothetical protein